MTQEEFLAKSAAELSKITSLGASRWSKYFSGVLMNEDIIYRTAIELDMHYLDFLEGLNKRRKGELQKSVLLQALNRER